MTDKERDLQTVFLYRNGFSTPFVVRLVPLQILCSCFSTYDLIEIPIELLMFFIFSIRNCIKFRYYIFQTPSLVDELYSSCWRSHWLSVGGDLFTNFDSQLNCFYFIFFVFLDRLSITWIISYYICVFVSYIVFTSSALRQTTGQLIVILFRFSK
jgi:hypothetical protein